MEASYERALCRSLLHVLKSRKTLKLGSLFGKVMHPNKDRNSCTHFHEMCKMLYSLQKCAILEVVGKIERTSMDDPIANDTSTLAVESA